MKITFGKYKGLNAEDIAMDDPSYILWLHKNNVVELPVDLVSLAGERRKEIFDNEHQDNIRDNWSDY